MVIMATILIHIVANYMPKHIPGLYFANSEVVLGFAVRV
jgi:hypothetical protein